MDEKKTAGKQLLLLLIGMLLCGSGLFLFSKQVSVGTYGNGFGSMYGQWGLFGGRGVPGGLVLVPLIIGVVVWVIFPNNFAGKFITILGTLFIVFGVISSVELRYQRSNLYEFVLMLIMIFGGAALALRILFMPDLGSGKKKKSKVDDVNDVLNG